MIAFWTSIGDVGHIAIYAAGASIASVLFQAMSAQGGILGMIGGLGKSIVDFFSANLSHNPPPPKV